MGADWIGAPPPRGEFPCGAGAQLRADDGYFARDGSVIAQRQPEQRRVLPKVAPTRSRGIEVYRAVDCAGLAEVLVEDQAAGTNADGGHRLRADQREVVERVADARHPVGHRVIAALSVCRVA